MLTANPSFSEKLWKIQETIEILNLSHQAQEENI